MYQDLELHDVQVIPPRQTVRHTASIIFVHGLGQSNLTWMAMAREAIAPSLPHVKWILPQAPRYPVTLNQSALRPSWFDIHRLPPTDVEFDEHSPQLAESISTVENLILNEVHSGIDSRRIILAGFSQGASLALMTALSSLHDLGGVVSLSGWIPTRFRQMLNTGCTCEPTPLLWCHGDIDDEIPLGMAGNAISFLQHNGFLVETKVYAGLNHSINDQEVNDLRDWLVKILVPC